MHISALLTFFFSLHSLLFKSDKCNKFLSRFKIINHYLPYFCLEHLNFVYWENV
jgi:hypothetical protein